MYIYIYMYIYICYVLCIYIYVCICVYIYIHIRIYIYIYSNYILYINHFLLVIFTDRLIRWYIIISYIYICTHYIHTIIYMYIYIEIDMHNVYYCVLYVHIIHMGVVGKPNIFSSRSFCTGNCRHNLEVTLVLAVVNPHISM